MDFWGAREIHGGDKKESGWWRRKRARGGDGVTLKVVEIGILVLQVAALDLYAPQNLRSTGSIYVNRGWRGPVSSPRWKLEW